jgi:hypothetical protein
VGRHAALLVATFCVAGCGGASSVDRAEPRTTPSAATVVDLVCHQDGAAEATPDDVEAQADGVHVHLTNDTGTRVFLRGLGVDAAEGTSDLVVAAAPGPSRVTCEISGKEDAADGVAAGLRVLDPNGYWHDASLKCAPNEMGAGGVGDSAAGAEGEKGDPVDVARAGLTGLRTGDTVGPAEYPEQEYPSVRVIRDGKVVAVAHLSAGANHGWLLDGYEACASSGVSF